MGEISEFKKKMKGRIESLKIEYGKMRTGRANISLLDGIKVDQYGSSSPINQVASLSVPEPRTISVQPWDSSMIKNIERAIQKSDLDLNPINDGKVIRLTLPIMTEERRKDLVKKAKKAAEDTKVSIRNIRRDANEDFKKREKNKDISEDIYHKALDDIQKVTNDYIKKVDEVAEGKEKDIMEI